jgi:hypothetical protein
MAMKPTAVAVMLLVMGLWINACGTLQTQEATYLTSARGQATQSDVRQKLGEPAATKNAADGSSVWVYEKREQQAGNRYTAPGMWCEQYVLHFDRQSVLSAWTHSEHFHGGELMPRECIPGPDRSGL